LLLQQYLGGNVPPLLLQTELAHSCRHMGGGMVAEQKDVWASGHSYEPYVGRWSRLVARQFVDWLGVPPSSDWIDVGCGTGALCEVILASASPRQVTGIDPSDGFVAFARKNVADPRASFRVGDAQALPLASHSFDAAVAGLVINFVPDQAKAVSEMRRATRREGVVAAYVWDYAGAMQMMRAFWDAAVALDPNAVALDEGRRFPVCHPEPLAKLFEDAGLKDVAVRAIDVPTVFKDFDDYWTPFLGGQAPAPGYCMSLSEDRRAVLRERIRAGLPVNDDGSIHLIARAWAARGTVP
jgi:SAM-dependent methyltransferase